MRCIITRVRFRLLNRPERAKFGRLLPLVVCYLWSFATFGRFAYLWSFCIPLVVLLLIDSIHI